MITVYRGDRSVGKTQRAIEWLFEAPNDRVFIAINFHERRRILEVIAQKMRTRQYIDSDYINVRWSQRVVEFERIRHLRGVSFTEVMADNLDEMLSQMFGHATVFATSSEPITILELDDPRELYSRG